MRRIQWKVTIGILFAVLVVFYLIKDPILRLPAKLITTDDHPQPEADAIVVLMGNIFSRTMQAAKLYNQGLAPRILIAKPEPIKIATLGLIPYQLDIVTQLLVKEGVQATQIQRIESQINNSTAEEADAVLGFASKENWRRLIIVTDWYHTSRAKWIFQQRNQFGIEIQMSPASTPRNNPDDWWLHEPGMIALFNEYVKWVYYLIRY